MTQRLQVHPGLALVTHKSCLDGTGSALVFLWAGGRRDRILFRNPSSTVLAPEDLPSDVTEVWYADCCPSTMDDPAVGRSFRVFDHHVSNERLFGADPRCVFDMKRSGSSLLAHVLGQVDDTESFEMDGRRELIRALESYDLGRFDYEPGQRLADVTATYSQDGMLDLMLELGPHGTLYDRDLTSRAEAMGAVRTLFVESAVRSTHNATLMLPLAFDGTLRPVRVAVVASPVYWKNDVSARILDSGEVDVAVVIDVTGGMTSLRSRAGGPDCSAIAAMFGGGGHARAAGFKVGATRILELMTGEVFG